MQTEKTNNAQEPQAFDIVWLIIYLWAKRMLILKISGITLLLSVVLYFCREKKYMATASILPCEEQGISSNMKGLAGLAGMANIDISAFGSNTSLQLLPDVYGEVVTSTASLLKIMDVPLTWTDPDTVLSMYEYTKQDTLLDFMKVLKMCTVGLPGTIKNIISPIRFPESSLPVKGKKELVPISLDMPRTLSAEKLRKMIAVDVDDDLNLVTVSVEAFNAKQSAEIAIAVIKQIQSSITEYKTENARKTLTFIQQRYEEMQEEYQAARKEYFDYADSHRYGVRERTDVRMQNLEDNYNMSYSVLNTIQQSYETAKIKLMEETPAFVIVEPVVVPYKKSSPKMLLHLIGGVALGFLFTIGFLIVRIAFLQTFNPKKYRTIYEEYNIEYENRTQAV